MVRPDDVRPGNRLVVGLGIVTVRGIKIDGERITFYWEEERPAVTQYRYGDAELVCA